MPGPLPDPNHRHRNVSVIPTTSLPANGRSGAPPRSPYALGAAGKRWWKWAWTTPQACAWDAGSVYAVARRAQLEDDLADERTAPRLRESRELEDRLGLTPKGLAALRWKIIPPDPTPAVAGTDDLSRKRESRRSRLTA